MLIVYNSHTMDDVTYEPNPDNNDGNAKRGFKAKASDDASAQQELVDEITSLKEKIKEIQAQRQEYLDSWQRAQAEFTNIRKREEQEKKEFVKFAAEKVLLDILPALESFDLARSQKNWESLDPQWKSGMESVYSQLVQALKKHGVEEMSPLGEQFNPSLHEAVTQAPVTEKEKDNAIVQVIQKGYTLNGKVIRAPKVIVGNLQ